MPQSTNEKHHPQNRTAADILVILIPCPCVYISVDMGHTWSTTCDIQDPIWLQAQHWQIQLHWWQQSLTLMHSILHSCNVLWINENASLPQSWHVRHLVPTCSTTQHQSSYVFWVFWQASIQSEKLNHCLMVKFWPDSQPDTIFKLYCNLVHTSYPPTQLYCST